jgi:hypothetical protein
LGRRRRRTGDDAAELFVAAVAETMLVARRDRYPDFPLDVLTRR